MTPPVDSTDPWEARFVSGLLASLLAGGLSYLVFFLVPTYAGRLLPLAALTLLLAGGSARQVFKSFEAATSGPRQLGSTLGLLLSALACVASLGSSALLLTKHLLGPLFVPH